MQISDWLGESIDPGARGNVEFRGPVRAARSRATILVLALVASVFVCASLVLALSYTGWPRVALLVGVPAYLVFAFFVHPKADTSNLGWFGGLMDNPLRWSDDLNRALVVVGCLLVPGRFVATALVAGAGLLVSAWRSTDAEWAAGRATTERRSDERRP